MAEGRAGGVYAAYTWGQAPRRVRLILLDNRTFRDAYDSPTHQNMLGAQQWAWLEGQLRSEEVADVTLIGVGLQFISRGDPWITESWSKLPQSQAKLVSLLAATRTRNAIIISGDMHVGEVHRITCGALGYPLYDATASGLTHAWSGPIVGTGWRALVAGAADETRVPDTLYQDKHWGVLDFRWDDEQPAVVWNLHAADGPQQGQVVRTLRIPLMSAAQAAEVGIAALEGDGPASMCSAPPPPTASPVESWTTTPWRAAAPRDAQAARHARWQHACNATGVLNVTGGSGVLGVNGQPPVPGADGWDLAAAIRACAAADLSHGYSAACDRVMRTCDPKITHLHSATYLAAHAALLLVVWGIIGGGLLVAGAAVVKGHTWPGGRQLWSAVGVALCAGMVAFVRVAI
jgi:hypothetical protein